jgi:hypothetical protein
MLPAVVLLVGGLLAGGLLAGVTLAALGEKGGAIPPPGPVPPDVAEGNVDPGKLAPGS